MIDIAADPYIEETIEIPPSTVVEEEPALSYEKASSCVPYLDVEPYMKLFKTENGCCLEERDVGTSNYFKAMLSYDAGDLMSRLKRKHRVLKNIWYMQTGEDNIENQVMVEDERRFTNVYKHLFKIDYVSDPKHFLIETPFTFIHWRRIEMASMLTT